MSEDTGGAGVPDAPNPPDGGTGDTQPATTTEPNVKEMRLAAEAKQYRLKLAEAEKRLQELTASTATEAEKAQAQARKEGEEAYRTKWRDAVAGNAAITKLHDRQVVSIDLALRALDLAGVDVDPETGRVDDAALDAMIDELIKKYPVLATGKAPEPNGKSSLGALSGDGQRQVTHEDMVRAAKDDPNALIRYGLGK